MFNNVIVNNQETTVDSSTSGMFDLVKPLANEKTEEDKNMVQTLIDESQPETPTVTPQDELSSFYKTTYPELFDEEGNLFDKDKALEEGIIVRQPTVPQDVWYDRQNVLPPDSLKNIPLDTETDGFETYVFRPSDEAQKVATKKQETQLQSEMTRLGFDNYLKKQNDTSVNKLVSQKIEEYVPGSDDEIEAQIAVRNLLSAQTSEEALEDIFKERVVNSQKEEAIQSIIKQNPEGGLSKFLQYTGVNGLNTITGFGSLVKTGTDGFTDGVEYIVERTRQSNPEVFQQIFGDTTSRKLADDISETIGGLLETSDIYIPLTGTLTAFPKLTRESIRLSNKLEDLVSKHAKATSKEDKTNLGKQIKETRIALASNVDKEISAMDGKQLAEKVAYSNNLDFHKFVVATESQRVARQAEAKKVASEAVDIKSQLIKEFEQSIGARSKLDINVISDETRLISKEVDGVLVLDPEKSRSAGKNLLNDVEMGDEDNIVLDTLQDLKVNILAPDKLDSFTAVAKELMERLPSQLKYTAGQKDKRLVDVLFELSVEDPDVFKTEELLEVLTKYNLSYEEYATMMLGSASQAGRVLQKFSQIARVAPTAAAKADAQEKKLIDQQMSILKTFRRVENIRRGIIVSQFATAARNASSGGIRAPLEGIQNIFDTALYATSKDGLMAGGKTLVSPENWRGSFRHLDYMFNPNNIKETEQYVDYILKNPQLGKQYERLFNQVSEVRRSTEDSSGIKVLDDFLTKAENVTDIINTPNRWQEYLLRRGMFLAELERLSKAEYGIDLISTLNKGRLDDLLNDTPELVGTGNKSFKTLVEESSERALDLTYGKRPDVPLFNEISNFITRNGLTAIPGLTFPRFMFNSAELAAQYSAGAFRPLIKRALYPALRKKELTSLERKQISRNIIGWTMVLPAAYAYRTGTMTDGDVPTDFKMIKIGDYQLDTTPQSPILGQALWIAELAKRSSDGTADEWYESGGREFLTTFLGVDLRVGGTSVYQDVWDALLAAESTTGRKVGAGVGQTVGEYVASFLTPANQILDTQRGLGYRTSEYKETAEEPSLDGTFMEGLGSGFLKPFKQRSLSTLFTPSSQDDLPPKETLFQEEGVPRERVAPILKVFTGLGLSQQVSDTGKFLQDLGFVDYLERPRSVSPGFKNFETKRLRQTLPTIVEFVTSKSYLDRLKSAAGPRDSKQLRVFIRRNQRKDIKDYLNKQKNAIDGFIENAGLPDSKLFTPEGKPVDIKMTEFMRVQQSFRRLSKIDRKLVLSVLPDLIKANPELGDEVDLNNPKQIGAMIKWIKNRKLN